MPVNDRKKPKIRSLEYAGAVATACVAITIKLSTAPMFGKAVPFLFFFGAVLFSAACWGSLPAILTLLITCAAFVYGMYHGIAEMDSWPAAMLIYVVESGVIIYMFDRLKRARSNLERDSDIL